ARQIMQQISAIDQDVNVLNTRRAQAIAAKDTVTADRIKLSIDQKNNERMVRQTDYNQLQAQIEDLNRQVAPLTTKRQALMQQHEKSAGDIAKQTNGVERRSQMVQAGQRAASKGATGQTGKAKSTAQTAVAPRTYVDLDVDRERTLVLRSFETANESGK